jgi:hypothetical protein
MLGSLPSGLAPAYLMEIGKTERTTQGKSKFSTHGESFTLNAWVGAS